jgi:hypothetical protein
MGKKCGTIDEYRYLIDHIPLSHWKAWLSLSVEERKCLLSMAKLYNLDSDSKKRI